MSPVWRHDQTEPGTARASDIRFFTVTERGDRGEHWLGPCLTVMPVPYKISNENKAAYCREPGLPGGDLGPETRYWHWYASALFLGARDQRFIICLLESSMDDNSSIQLLFCQLRKYKDWFCFCMTSFTPRPVHIIALLHSGLSWLSTMAKITKTLAALAVFMSLVSGETEIKKLCKLF